MGDEIYNPQSTADNTYCRWHPSIETVLQCYQCAAPICPKCAQRTPVGYLCPACQKDRKKRFDQSRPTDYALAGLVSLALGALAGWFLPMLGWFTVFISPVAGALIAEVVWRLVGRRYSQYLWQIVVSGVVIGALPPMLLLLFGVLVTQSAFGLLNLLWSALHIAMAVGSVMARLRLR